MGLLQRPRPEVHVPVLVVGADPLEHLIRGPRLDDQVVGLVEPGPGAGRVDAVAEILPADPADEPGDHPAVAEVIEHRDLLGDAQRVAADADGVAEHHDLGPLGAAGRAAAMMFGDGISPYAVWWCSLTAIPSKPSWSAYSSSSRYRWKLVADLRVEACSGRRGGVYRLYLGVVIRPPEPGVIGRDHVESARQQPVELEPGPGSAGRVQEEQRLARAAAEQVDAAAGQLEVLSGRGAYCGRGPRPVRHRVTSART